MFPSRSIQISKNLKTIKVSLQPHQSLLEGCSTEGIPDLIIIPDRIGIKRQILIFNLNSEIWYHHIFPIF